MIAALVPNIVSMTSSLDCSYSFHYFYLLMSKFKNFHCHSLSLSFTVIVIHCHCHSLSLLFTVIVTKIQKSFTTDISALNVTQEMNSFQAGKFEKF